jgi:uncharacterized protein YjbI with pentapeptide repeats
MAVPEQIAKLREGVSAWNKWRQEHPDVSIDLHDANLGGADLRGAQLSGALLAQSILDKADLSGADLTGAHLATAILTRTNLKGASLSSADLRWASLTRALLSEARLEKANLLGADLKLTELRRAILFEANLENAHLTRANLTEADLRSANLLGADFSGAQVADCNFNGALLARTVFGDTDLSMARGLEKVEHIGPSVVGVDTIYRSQGKIPALFLRGCGLPDAFITYIGSLVGIPIEFYSCFISHSTKDQDFAERLYADLQSRGVRCWFAREDVKGGKKLYD